MRISSVLAVLALWFGSTALADDVGLQLPPDWWDGLPSSQKLRNDLVPGSMTLGKLRVVFEKSRLADVAAEAKGSRIKHRGDAGASMYWLCYRFKEKGIPRQLYLTAHGEMGGPEHLVGGVVLKNAVSEEPDCPELPPELLPANIGIGLGLGSRYEDFLHRLGKPDRRDGDRAMWMFERVIKSGGSTIGGELQSVEVEFREGKTAILSFNQVTSY